MDRRMNLNPLWTKHKSWVMSSKICLTIKLSNEKRAKHLGCLRVFLFFGDEILPGLFHKPRIASPLDPTINCTQTWLNCCHKSFPWSISTSPCQVWDKTCRIFVGESNYPSHRSRWEKMVEGFNFLERWWWFWWWLVDVFVLRAFDMDVVGETVEEA